MVKTGGHDKIITAGKENVITADNTRNLSEKKGKSPGSTACMGKILASVLLKMFVNGKELCYTTDAPLAHEQNSTNVNSKQSMVHEDQINITTQ